MNSGDLRNRITIKYLSDSKNEYGENTDEWLTLRTIWASINPILGKNYYAAMQNQTDVKVKINTRYFSDIKKEMRVYYGTTIYEIVDVIDVNLRHQELVLMCSEVI